MSFAKINTSEICKKFIFRENKYTRKNKYTYFLFFLRVNQLQQFFHCYLPAFPLILIKTFADCPLIQLYFFLFSLTFCRFVKNYTREISYILAIRKNLYTRNFQKLVIRENKYSRNTIFFSSRK